LGFIIIICHFLTRPVELRNWCSNLALELNIKLFTQTHFTRL